MKSLLAACALAVTTLIGVSTHADSWMPPETRIYLSSDSTYRFTVVPRSVYSRTQKAPDGNRSFCEGTLERREGDSYRQVWRNPLVNSEAPVEALVAERTGYVVTFDDWGSMGYGDDVVVIYAPTGKRVRKLALQDFLSTDEIEALPHTVSSIWWRGEHSFNRAQDHVELKIALKSGWWKASRKVSIRLSDGAVAED